jgi:hypothetical protein
MTKLEFVDDANKWYSWISMQALGFIAAIQGLLALVPTLAPGALAAMVPFLHVSYATLGVDMTLAAAVIGAIGRLIKQAADAADSAAALKVQAAAEAAAKAKVEAAQKAAADALVAAHNASVAQTVVDAHQATLIQAVVAAGS